MKVLVVDDDAPVRESVCKVLQQEGYETVRASDGPTALKQFATQPIDLLVLDLGLPVKSGWEVFEEITRKHPTLPIILITGQANKYRSAVAAGAGALLEKPLDVAALLEVMQELLAEPKERRLQRLTGRNDTVRHIPPGLPKFLRQFRERYEKPDSFKLPHP